MSAQIDIQNACKEPVPDEDDIRRWITCALGEKHRDSELSVRLVDENEMTALNHTYRGKAGSTNVLSFPADLPADISLPLLGDIVICAAVVAREAQQQQKSLDAHWAHMSIHGTLHLQGYDHIDAQQAHVMETLETQLLHRLGYPCPYGAEAMENQQPSDDQYALERTSP